MKKITHFLCVALLVISPVYMYAQDGWTEVGPDLHNPIGSSYSNFCADAQGNLYIGIERMVYKKDVLTNIWSPVGSPLTTANLNASRKINSVAVDNAGNLYATGGFRNSNDKGYVAKWNGASWEEVGNLSIAFFADSSKEILCIKTDASGNLYAAGQFTNILGKPFLAKWNGSTWSESGTLDASGDIKSIECDKSGNIYIGGTFKNTVGQYYVGKWNGSAWSAIGVNKGPSPVMCADKAGNIYIGGYVNASSKYGVAKWDGTTWTELGGATSLNANNVITSITADTSGNLYATGSFTNASAQLYVAKWNGTNWTQLGNLNAFASYSPTLNNTFVFADEKNKLYVAGYTTYYGFKTSTIGAAYKHIVKWTDVEWAPEFDSTSSIINKQIGTFEDMAADNNGNIYTTMSSIISTSGSLETQRHYVVKWDGATWAEVGTGVNALNLNNWITLLACDKAGNVYITGRFTDANFKYYVAKWDGTTWTQLGTLDASQSQSKYIDALAVDSLGNVYVAGTLNTGGTYYIAKWNGSYWSSFASFNAKSGINKLKFDKWDNLYASYRSSTNNTKYISKWNGTTWTQLGSGVDTIPITNGISAIEVDNSGNVYVGEDYGYPNGFMSPSVGGYVYKWNGTTWTKAGGPNNSLYGKWGVRNLAIDMEDNVYASKHVTGSSETSIESIYKWDGTSWNPAGSEGAGINTYDEIDALIYNKGNLYTCGSIRNERGIKFIAKYTVPSSNKYIFTGTGAWENAANWNTGIVPDMYADVIIESGKIVTVNSNQTIKSIKVSPLASVTVSSGFTLTVLH